MRNSSYESAGHCVAQRGKLSGSGREEGLLLNMRSLVCLLACVDFSAESC